MPSVEGKIAIVTGASSGIGQAIATELVSAGMTVAGLARRIDRLEALAESLKGKSGKLSPVKCDVTSLDDIKKAFDWVEANLGAPTAVINNAGVYKTLLFSNGNMEDAKWIMETNCIGVSACCKEALCSMLKHKTDGTIININSIGGHNVLPSPGMGPYCASKYAVTAITEALRNEITMLGADIRVTSLSPGVIQSELTVDVAAKKGWELGKTMLPASDVADCVLFILKAPQRLNISELTVQPVRESALSFVLQTTELNTSKNK